MVYESEDSTDFRRSQSSSQSSQLEMELPSETSVFLAEDSDNDNTSFTVNVNSGESENVSNRRNSVRRSSSRNLGILVITDRLSLSNDSEKMGPAVAIMGGIATISDEEAQKLQVSPKKVVKCDDGEIREKRGFCKNYGGILLTLMSGLVFTIGGVIVKYLKEYHPFTLGIFRFQGILLPSLVMVLYAYYVQKVPVFEPVWPPTHKQKRKRILGLIFRSVFGSTALFLHFYALQRLDVADALVIGSCQPVFVTLAAYFFLGEACGVLPVFTALLSIVGVGVISRPPILTGQESFDRDALIGAGFSMASMLTATMVFVIIRYLKDVHVSLMTLFLGCWGTAQSIICSVVIGEFKLPQTLEHWLLAVALAGITLLGQVTMTLALQCEQAGSVAVVRTCDCLFAFLLQFVLLSTVPDLYSLTGACIIIFCVILTTFRKWITTLPVNHPARKRFSFVMV